MANNRGAKLEVDHNHYGPFGITVIIVLTIEYYNLLKISIN